MREIKRKGVLLELTPKELAELLPNKNNRMNVKGGRAKRARLNPIKENILTHGYKRAFPIVINDDLIICDGHHRAEACVELNVNGWVIVDPDAKVEDYAQFSATTNKWTVGDFVKAKVNGGSKAAKIIEYLMDKFEFKAEMILRIAFGFRLTKNQIIKMINEDQIKFNNWNELEDKCKHLSDCMKLIPFWQEKIATAISRMMQHEQYSESRMIHKLEAKGGDLFPSSTTKNYLEQLQRIYNHGGRASKVYFL